MGAREHSTQRRMRKGTHSCVECRQRKVRCIMAANARACEGCVMRDLRCTDQEHGISKAEVVRKNSKLRKRRIELQSLISQILQKLPSNVDQARGSKLELTVVDTLKKLQSELLPPSRANIAASDGNSTNPLPVHQGKGLWTSCDGFDKVPLLSIFKNEILHQRNSEGAEPSAFLFERKAQAVTALRAVAPDTHDLTLLLEADQSVWRVWQKVFPEVGGTNPDGSGEFYISSLRSYVTSVVESDNAIAIAKALLCSALCVQQLPSTIDLTKTHLPVSSEALQEQFLTPVEDFLSDEGCACTLDGLQCMILQTRIYIIIGMPYRAWLIFRRAIGYAHLLELHRQPLHSVDALSRRKRALWLQLWHGERYLSLILGLPYSTADNFYDLDIYQSGASESPNGEHLLLVLGTIAGKVIDRDQRPTASNFLATMQIDQDLDECKNIMPKVWWETEPGPQMSLGAIADMFVAKFAYQNIRRLLHLPFMLQSAVDPRYQFNRIAALDASREMIKYYRIVRDVDRPVLTACNLADFQVFTAAMVLVLDLLGQSSRSTPCPTSDQTESDWDIVNSVMYDLKRVSKESPSGVAIQAAQILEDLYRSRFGTSDNGDRTYQAIVPYFGKLTIRMGNAYKASNSESTQRVQDQVLSPSNPAIGFNRLLEDQSITFDSYFPLPEGCQPWQQMGTEWSPTPDFNLCDDWSCFLNTHEFV
jgi:hypothetical protein